MKKAILPISVHILWLGCLILLLSSFIIAPTTNQVEAVQNAATTSAEHFKLGFWGKLALAGASFGGYRFVQRRMRRRFGALGCLGAILALVLGVVLIALLPIILIVGLILAACGVSISTQRGWYRRRWHR